MPSAITRWPALTPAITLRAYIRYYEALLPYASRCVVGTFDLITNHFDVLLAELTARSGLELPPYDPAAPYAAAVYDPEADGPRRAPRARRADPAELDSPALASAPRPRRRPCTSATPARGTPLRCGGRREGRCYRGRPSCSRDESDPVTTRYSIILGCPRSGTDVPAPGARATPRHRGAVRAHLPPQLPHLAEAMADDETVTGLLELSLLRSLEFFAEYAERAKSWVVGEWTRRNVSTAELLASVRGRRTVESVIYKEPFLAFAPQLAYRAVPDAKIVHIHRDGRDCADSLERKYHTLTDEKLSLAPVERGAARSQG